MEGLPTGGGKKTEEEGAAPRVIKAGDISITIRPEDITPEIERILKQLGLPEQASPGGIKKTEEPVPRVIEPDEGAEGARISIRPEDALTPEAVAILKTLGLPEQAIALYAHIVQPNTNIASTGVIKKPDIVDITKAAYFLQKFGINFHFEHTATPLDTQDKVAIRVREDAIKTNQDAMQARELAGFDAAKITELAPIYAKAFLAPGEDIENLTQSLTERAGVKKLIRGGEVARLYRTVAVDRKDIGSVPSYALQGPQQTPGFFGKARARIKNWITKNVFPNTQVVTEHWQERENVASVLNTSRKRIDSTKEKVINMQQMLNSVLETIFETEEELAEQRSDEEPNQVLIRSLEEKLEVSKKERERLTLAIHEAVTWVGLLRNHMLDRSEDIRKKIKQEILDREYIYYKLEDDLRRVTEQIEKRENLRGQRKEVLLRRCIAETQAQLKQVSYFSQKRNILTENLQKLTASLATLMQDSADLRHRRGLCEYRLAKLMDTGRSWQEEYDSIATMINSVPTLTAPELIPGEDLNASRFIPQ